MRRPSYGAVTGVTAVLAGVCALRVAFQRYIPPPHPGLAAAGRGDYVGQGASQDVEWRAPDEAAFLQAQTLSRPLLIVVGLPWSGAAREADRAFAEPEVARAINRGFVAIRIDAARDPRWLSQFLSLQRARAGIGSGFQAWTFDLKRRLIGFTSRVDAGDDLRYTALLDSLLQSQSDFADAVMNDADPPLEVERQADVRQLLQSALDRVSLGTAATSLVRGMDPDWGGWSENGALVDRPLAFRFLQLAGAWPEAGRSLRAFALSPRADWLDGGFFRLARRADGFPEYDKTTVLNAHLAEALAVQDALRPDPLLRRAARRTVGWILGLREGDGVPGGEIGDEDDLGRSARASFSSQRLRDGVSSGALTEADRSWAVSTLGLGRLPHLVRPTPGAADDPRLSQVLAELRKAAGPPRETAASDLCDVDGTVAACLARCARLWGDRDLALASGAMVDWTNSFGPNPLPRHVLTDPPDARPYLGDALACADARLEDFLSSGRVPSLESGLATLRAALRTFGGPEPGILRPSPAGTALLPIPGAAPVPEVPQVTDDGGEALSASALRLLRAYATVLGPSAADLDEYAGNLAPHLGAVADALPVFGGAFGALARQSDSRAAFVVGPDALARSATLARLLPNRLVVPAIGPARPDLQRRLPGLYLVSPQGIEGPLTQAELLRRLPNTLSLEG